MELHPRVFLKKFVDQAGLVGGEIIENDVNLLPGWAMSDNFFEKCHEILTGVACRGLAVHATRGSFQGSAERQRSVAIVLETVALDSSQGERQYGIEAIQSLNRGLLIHAEHSGVLGRIQI